MKKILVTGLCLSGNLGGPAMALTLINELKKRFEDLEFIFAVDANNYNQEKRYADIYGVRIVKQITIPGYILNKYMIRGFYQFVTMKYKRIGYQNQPNRTFWLNVYKGYMDTFSECDIVIDMMGISYVGDSAGNYLEGLNSYSSYFYAKKHKKPFVRFIQSFGPFNKWYVRMFAKNEFKHLPFIFARGKQSAYYCSSIAKNTKVYDFPDIAILLKSDKGYVETFLKNNNLVESKYIVVSPSLVIESISGDNNVSVGNNYIESFFLFLSELIKKGENIVFLPHMHSNSLAKSDKDIAKKIINKLNSYKCYLVEDEINAMEAKSIISNSKLVITSRYHALVAAVSTNIPSIAIGWNTKYIDLMQYYGRDEFVLDARRYNPLELSKEVLGLVDELCEDSNLKINMHFQKKNEKRLNKAFDLLENWIRRMV